MDVYEAAVNRRSIRRFKDIAVPYEALERCVNAGRLAPSAMNYHPLEYIIVDDEQLVPGVTDTIKSWSGQKRTPGDPMPENPPKAGIVILIDRNLEQELGGNRRFSTYDAALAAENIMLVATEQGLGSCAILSYEESILKQILNIPENLDIALLLVLGYPDESPVAEPFTGSIARWVDDRGVRHVPKRRLEDILHRNKYT